MNRPQREAVYRRIRRLLGRRDRPRGIDRVIRYFGDLPVPVLVPVARPGRIFVTRTR
jgi:hypothetical protein